MVGWRNLESRKNPCEGEFVSGRGDKKKNVMVKTMTGITIDKWGPSFWCTLHVMAHSSPKEMDREQQQETLRFLKMFATRIPCPQCRQHFTEFLEQEVGPDTLQTRDSFVSFMNDAHNDVNMRTGKRTYTLNEHYKVYSRPLPRMVVSFEIQLFVACAIGYFVIQRLSCQRKNYVRV